mmetsp:Transcript_11122/g.29562  ORF Transcript_11122/g.29562 Transcript_11122/m.29562 type:complete len:251 (-) Transcript_11122:4-756(-)
MPVLRSGLDVRPDVQGDRLLTHCVELLQQHVELCVCASTVGYVAKLRAVHAELRIRSHFLALAEILLVPLDVVTLEVEVVHEAPQLHAVEQAVAIPVEHIEDCPQRQRVLRSRLRPLPPTQPEELRVFGVLNELYELGPVHASLPIGTDLCARLAVPGHPILLVTFKTHGVREPPQLLRVEHVITIAIEGVEDPSNELRAGRGPRSLCALTFDLRLGLGLGLGRRLHPGLCSLWHRLRRGPRRPGFAPDR